MNAAFQRQRPGFRAYYRLGVSLSRQMRPNHSFVEIGRQLGITRQNAYTEVMVALGKLAYRLASRLDETRLCSPAAGLRKGAPGAEPEHMLSSSRIVTLRYP